MHDKISEEILSNLLYSKKQNDFFIATIGKTGDDQELVAYAHSIGYKEFKGLNWIIVIEHETEELFSPISNILTIMIIVITIFAMFALIFSLILSRSITKPIIKVAKVAKEYSKGNLTKKIGINSNDEIGVLSSTFEQMAENLKTQQDNLEDQVVERTNELENKVYELQKFKKVTVGRELKMIELKNKIKELEDRWEKNQSK